MILKKLNIIILTVFCTLWIHTLSAQAPNDCQFAVVVCGNSNLDINVGGIGTQELTNTNTCGSQENNSIWLEVNIAQSGTLGFILTPESNNITEDYDFFIYGPNRTCGNLGQAIRCSTTNPLAANQTDNLTGLNATETETSEGPGADGNSFVRELDVLAGERYFIVIDRPIGNSPFSLEWTGTASFPDNPVNALNQNDLTVETCDNIAPFDDGITQLNLTTLTTDIIGNQGDVTVSYHRSESDANINADPLGNAFNTDPASPGIFARIQNITSGCFIINQVNVTILPGPDFNPPEDFNLCDSTDFDNDNTNGQTEFDFSVKTNEITSGFDANNYNVSYHLSRFDAENNTGALPLNFYNTTPTPIEIFVRIEEFSNTTCIGFSSFNINVSAIPQANDVTIIQCDEDGIPEGFTTFNINQIVDDITGGEANRNVQYYLSAQDAQDDVDEINGEAFNNFFNPQIIYTRVTDTQAGCTNFSQISLTISNTSSNDTALSTCDDDGTEDGFHVFNLNDASNAVLAGLPDGLDLEFYETYDEALTETNPLSANYTNTIPYNQTIYARVENANACFGISEIQLTVFELPNIETAFETLYCLNDFPELITLDGGVINDTPNNFFYQWSTGATTMQIQVNQPGTYSVRVTNTDGCFKDRTITVLPSNVATITDVQVIDASQNNSIAVFVSGEGDYEYALDNSNGPYQDDNNFDNLQPGLYTVYVRDKNNCGITEELVSVLGFPKFFTPNGDADNNFWQIKGIISELQTSTPVLIFDRYGKLLVELNPLSQGWDGTYNGALMPASDYWFTVTLADGRTFTSHFALVR